ncbi:MAG: ZIP family metal transporter [Polyangiales bacterium]
MGSVLAGSLASLVAGACTGLGAIPIIVHRQWSERTQMLMLAWAGGVMLGATIFSLCVPALELVQRAGGSETKAALVVAGGVLLGALGIWALHHVTPHLHFEKGREGPRRVLNRHLLFVLAISLHNLPEGMSVGVAYGADMETGFTVALGMALQNVPEGFAVAAAMQADGASLWRSVGISLASGLVEPIGGVFGAIAVSLSQSFLPWGLAVAGGAMLYVILGEIVPETHGRGREQLATLSLVGGFVVMMVLDVVLG